MLVFVSVLGFSFALAAILLTFTIVVTQNTLSTLTRILYIYNFIIIVIYIFYNFIVLTETSDSLEREAKSGRLNLLFISNLKSKNIIYGKWLAAIQHYFLSSVCIAAAWSIGIIASSFASSMEMFQTALTAIGRVSNGIPINVHIHFPEPISLFTSSIFVFTILIFSISFTASCGIFFASLGRSRASSLVSGAVLRIGIPFLPVAILGTLFTLLSWLSWNDDLQNVTVPFIQSTYTVLSAFSIVTFNYGFAALASASQVEYLLSSSQMTTQLYEVPIWSDNIIALLYLTFGCFYYITFTWILLRFSQQHLVKRGASH